MLGLDLMKGFIMRHPVRVGILCALLFCLGIVNLVSCVSKYRVKPPLKLTDEQTDIEQSVKLEHSIEVVVRDEINNEAKEANVKVIKVELFGIFLNQAKDSALVRSMVVHLQKHPTDSTKMLVGMRLDIIKVDLVKTKWTITSIYNVRPFTPIAEMTVPPPDAGANRD